MKLIALAALTAALSLPVAVLAQQAGPQPGQPAVSQPAQGAQTTPRIYRRWSQMLAQINLSSQQHEQIQNFLDQYVQAHPAGSPRDPQAARQLRDQIMGVLTPDQQTQFKQQMAQMRAQRQQMQQQRMQQQQQYPQQQQQYPQQPQYQQQYPAPAATP